MFSGYQCPNSFLSCRFYCAIKLILTAGARKKISRDKISSSPQAPSLRLLAIRFNNNNSNNNNNNNNIFFPVAVETTGAWNHLAIELIQEIGRRITAVTDEPIDVLIPATLNSPPEGERGYLPGNVQHRVNAVRSHYLLIISSSLWLCASGPK